MSRFFPIVIASALSLSAFACGGSQPPPKTEEAAKDDKPVSEGGSGLTMEQELGSLDESAVSKKFDELLNGKLEECHKQGRDRLEFLSGDAKVFLRIGKDGRVKYGHFEESTIGDRDTEKCVLDALSGADWPKPKGGEGEARHTFGWSAGGERAPTPWAPEKVNTALEESKEIKQGVAKCKAGITGDFRVTAYVEPGEAEGGGDTAADAHPGKGGGKGAGKGAGKGGGKKGGHKGDKKGAGKGGEHGGKFKAIGVVPPNREGGDKVDCIVDAIRPLPLPSPGSYVAKVTFTL
jgi:hypothetical protein